MSQPCDSHTDSDIDALEHSRLAELHWLRILHTPPEERFDRYTRLVAQVFGVSGATVTLMAKDCQWAKSTVNIEISGVPREHTFCTHTLGVDFLEVPDARADPLFRDNPFVSGEPYIRFYAGVPLSGPTGQPIGTLCVVDYAPRALTGDERERLRAFADLIEDEINIGQRDPASGLPTIELVERHLDWALSRLATDAPAVHVIQARITNQDDIVMAAGREAGQAVLHELSQRLRDVVGAYDIIGRAGSDRFVAALFDDNQCTPIERADALLRCLSEPVHAAAGTQRPTIAVGVSVAPDDGRCGQMLFDHAHTALQAAMETGQSNAACRFSHGLQARLQQDHEQRTRLTRALEQGALHQHYQPFIDLETGVVTGFEALARWRDADLGDICPDIFIPLCENDDHLRHELTVWALDQACAQISALDRVQENSLRASVNIPAAELLDPAFPEAVASVLATHGLGADRLILELTERGLVTDPENTLGIMADLRRRGVLFAVDDFGTGYSSLGYLRTLPVDIVKIDRSFVNALSRERRAGKLMRATVDLCRSLDLQIIVEGIETREQLSVLHRLGCDQGQGFLLACPADAGALTTILGERNGWR